MIEVKELVKSFDGFRALDGLSLSVPEGEIYGLVGPNGAGKSTLIRHLAGIYRQDSGEVKLFGEDVFENPALKERIAYIPDDIFYFQQATVRDMMSFYRDINRRFCPDRFKALSQVFDIDPSKQMRRLSKGMQKQVAFWLAISCRPAAVILDEPVDGLDPIMRRQIWSLLMQDVADNGTTVLVSSHNLRELEDVCGRVGIMNGGRMLLERSLSELQENIVKVQLALPDGTELTEDADFLHVERTGRIYHIIMHGKAETVGERFAGYDPYFTDVLPLTLEEIFIYELGGADREIKNIIL